MMSSAKRQSRTSGGKYFALHVNSCFNYLPAAEYEDDKDDLYQPVI